MAKRCNACDGVYEPIGADGVAYYHVCPPITLVPAMRDGKPRLVPLTALAKTDEIIVQRGAARVRVAVGATLPDDVRIGDVTAERENHRDETPVPAVIDGELGTAPRADGVGASEATIEATTGLEVFDQVDVRLL